MSIKFFAISTAIVGLSQCQGSSSTECSDGNCDLYRCDVMCTYEWRDAADYPTESEVALTDEVCANSTAEAKDWMKEECYYYGLDAHVEGSDPYFWEYAGSSTSNLTCENLGPCD